MSYMLMIINVQYYNGTYYEIFRRLFDVIYLLYIYIF